MIEDMRWRSTPEGWVLEAYDGHQWFAVKCAHLKNHTIVVKAEGYQFFNPKPKKERKSGRQ